MINSVTLESMGKTVLAKRPGGLGSRKKQAAGLLSLRVFSAGKKSKMILVDYKHIKM